MENARSKIANGAFYRFIDIAEPELLKDQLKARCTTLGLKGTILVAREGINGMLAGSNQAMTEFAGWLSEDSRFADIIFKWSYSEFVPFRRLLIKVKSEILTLRRQEINPERRTSPYISPRDLESLLQGGSEATLIDVRNEFEVGFGTFKGAINPQTQSFSDFPDFIDTKLKLSKEKTIVTFCTGGIRCEKASVLLLQAGYKNVFQLQGGILAYLAQTAGTFFEGSCFVFDEREALDKNLKPVKAGKFCP